MAIIKNRKRLIKFFVIFPLIALFIVIANICDTGILPKALQNSLDAVNNATGGIIYQQSLTTKALSVHFIDVGQGDSILICCNGKNMLIDGGTPQEAETVEKYLRNQGVKTLDYVVGTHPHDDHIGGLTGVIENFNVGKVIMTNATASTQSYKNLLNAISAKKLGITLAKCGDKYNLGGASFIILAPVRTYDDLNDMSVVIKLTYRQNSFLFTGDASESSETDMLSHGEDVSADVLKVGHHGSSTATTKDFLKAVRPSYAVISVGIDNTYGLPESSVVRRIEESGIKLFRTDYNGTVVIESDGKNLNYKKEK